MKKHLYKLTALAAVTTLIAMQSCKKDNDTKSREDMLIGTWNGYQTGIDSNKNGVWDVSERQAVPPTASGQLRFESGGTGWMKVDTTLEGRPMAWTLLNNDSDLRVIVTNTNGNIDTLATKLIALQDTELTMQRSMDGSGVYTSFRKR